LHILGASGEPGLRLTGSNGFEAGVLFENTTSGTGRTYSIYSANTGVLTIGDETASQVRIAIDPNGKVGIGTASPSYTLDVNGNARVSGLATGGLPRVVFSNNDGSLSTSGAGTNGQVLTWTSTGPAWSYNRPFVVTIFAGNNNLTWTNMPAAVTELAGVTRYRTIVDLTNVTQARITVVVMVVGSVYSELAVQYSKDQVSWFYLDGSNGPAVGVGVFTGVVFSFWANITPDARADLVYLRIVGRNGDGVADPQFGLITVQFR
jgi:hypothetical protein